MFQKKVVAGHILKQKPSLLKVPEGQEPTHVSRYLSWLAGQASGVDTHTPLENVKPDWQERQLVKLVQTKQLEEQGEQTRVLGLGKKPVSHLATHTEPCRKRGLVQPEGA